jgi:hypothetical protein
MILKGNKQKQITMKTTRLYTMLTLLLFAGEMTLRAQEYVPIIQEGNEWNTLTVITDYWPNYTYINEVDWCSGDTIIEDVRYTKIMGTANGDDPRLFSLLREEEGKVWYRDLNHQTDILLYDFTANVGDTLFESYLVVDSISIEHLGGVDRKKYWFGLEYEFTGEPYALETWIEGIGSDLGLLNSGSYYYCGSYSRALCFHQNGELVWYNPEYGSCTVTGVEEIKEPIFIYPNPAKEMATIGGSEVAEVQVYNAFGQLVNTIHGTNEISVTGLAEGVYLLRVTATDGKTYRTRLIVRQ